MFDHDLYNAPNTDFLGVKTTNNSCTNVKAYTNRPTVNFCTALRNYVHKTGGREGHLIRNESKLYNYVRPPSQ